MNASPTIWFQEPIIRDDTFASRGESTSDWLSRSTTTRAKECRRFLNENISKLPIENQLRVKNDLKDRFESAFFEIVVARLLQEWGATITIEESNINGKKPDFLASFPEGQITVEAKSPVINGHIGSELKNRIPLLDYIESKIPEGWHVGVWGLPTICGSDSKKEFKLAVDRMLSIPLPSPDSEGFELIEELYNGAIYLYLHPAKSNSPKLMWEAPISTVSNSKERIRYAIRSKKKQVRNSEFPVILAIQTGFLSSIEDFDMALFGGGFSRYDEQDNLVETGFYPVGEFGKNAERDTSPVYAGVLAFLDVNLANCISPIFYRNPRFTGQLPNAILQLEQRIYDKEQNRIIVQAPQRPCVANRLNFINILNED